MNYTQLILNDLIIGLVWSVIVCAFVLRGKGEKTIIRLKSIEKSIVLSFVIVILASGGVWFVSSTFVIPHVLFVLISILIPMSILYIITVSRVKTLSRGLLHDYKQGFKQHFWSEKSYNYLQSIEWDNTVFKNVQSKDLIHLSRDPENPSIIMSVSANRAQHELKLFEITKDHYSVRFICSDLQNAKAEAKLVDDDRFSYLDGNRDAFNLSETLSELELEKVNVLLDKKGALWHNASQVKVDEFFQIAHKHLSSDGVLIIDGSVQSSLKQMVSYVYYHLFDRIIFPTERSTVSKIKKYIGPGSFAGDHFEKHEVGSGMYRVIVFKKKEIRGA
ncbi:hypothetical protein [Paenibacillus amylolyticus]|uniref:hypothetical protein n=1 Tax=Paenibacillus amylolyticus TaxID=1451 RepID=UPI003390AFE4